MKLKWLSFSQYARTDTKTVVEHHLKNITTVAFQLYASLLSEIAIFT